MAIVFVNRYFHPDLAATAQMLADLAFDTAGRGHTVVVITSRQRLEDPAARLPARERVHGLCVHRVWTTRFGRGGTLGRAVDYLTFHLSAAVRLARTARAGDTVVAATDPPLLGVTLGWVARRRGARLVNWLHDIFPEVAAAVGIPLPFGRSGTRLWRLLRRVRDASFAQAACNVALGEVMAWRLESLGVHRRRIAVIHNWSDGAAIRPLEHADNELRATLAPGAGVVVAYSGNLGRAHDLSSLAEAAAALSDLADLHFVVLGGGAGLGPVRDAVRARALRNVSFAPYQPRARLNESLGLADIHLISLRPALEGLVVPSKLYGVLAAGRPAVHLGDPAGEVGRVLAQARCGITVAPDDPEALAGALRELHGDASLRRRMGENARGVFEARFDRSRAMDAWMRVLS